MLKLIKKRKIIFISLAIFIAIVSIIIFNQKKENTTYVTVIAKKDKLLQTVSEIGTIKMSDEIELSFLQNGKIKKTSANIGDKVEQGEVLAELDYDSLAIKKIEVQASLDIAKANLNKLLRGASVSEIAVSEARVKQAETNYLSALDNLQKIKNTTEETIKQAQKTFQDLSSNQNLVPYEQAVVTAKINLKNTQDTYKKSIDNKQDTAITATDNNLTKANTALDIINTLLINEDLENLFSVKNPIHLDKLSSSYKEALVLFQTASDNLELLKISPNNSNTVQVLSYTLNCLNETFNNLNYCYNALENTVISSDYSQTNLDTDKATINTQLTSISQAISSIQTAQQNLTDAMLTYETKTANAKDNLSQAGVNLANAINTASNSLSSAKINGEQLVASANSNVNTALESWNIAKVELEKLKAPARYEDISLVRAQVKQAQASLDLVSKQIEDSMIIAPISGTVTKIEYKNGEQVLAGRPAIVMLKESNFEIEVDISENDISKIKLNNPVEITLDSIGEDILFDGFVNFIEPAETVIQDVIYYKVNIKFHASSTSTSEEKNNILKYNIKSGMTANAIITTFQKENILAIPSRAIIQKNNQEKFVRILFNNKVTEKPVQTGLQGDEGMIEIISGVNEGELVVTSTKEK